MAVLMTTSPARLQRRAHILQATHALLGVRAPDDFDAAHSPLCAIDLVMVAGSPWLKDGLERDFAKDEPGYRKIGGGANTPNQAYFFRSSSNLMHYLKRTGFYVPRGKSVPAAGMACFFEWDDRGRFNFTPDRVGIVLAVDGTHVTHLAVAQKVEATLVVRSLTLAPGDSNDLALIGFSDLP